LRTAQGRGVFTAIRTGCPIPLCLLSPRVPLGCPTGWAGHPGAVSFEDLSLAQAADSLVRVSRRAAKNPYMTELRLTFFRPSHDSTERSNGGRSTGCRLPQRVARCTVSTSQPRSRNHGQTRWNDAQGLCSADPVVTATLTAEFSPYPRRVVDRCEWHPNKTQ